MTLGDVLLVSALVVVSISGLLAAQRVPASAAVEVWRDGHLVGRFPLAKEQTVHVGQNFDIEIQPGRVRVAKTDCPLRLCQQMGWQSLPGRTIVCVPNRVVITITGNDEPGYDAESY